MSKRKRSNSAPIPNLDMYDFPYFKPPTNKRRATGKETGGSWHSFWDKVLHPIDNWREHRAEKEDEEEGYDILDGLDDDDIEDLLAGVSRKGSTSKASKKKKGDTDKEIAELLAALSASDKDPDPAGTIKPTTSAPSGVWMPRMYTL